MLTLYFWLLRCMCEFSIVEETSTVSPQGYFTSILLPCQLQAGGQTRGITWTSTHLQFLSRIVSFFRLPNAQVFKDLACQIPTVSICTSSQFRSAPSHHVKPPNPPIFEKRRLKDLSFTHPTPPKRRHTNKRFPFFQPAQGVIILLR
jgi:hypothetical protein